MERQIIILIIIILILITPTYMEHFETGINKNNEVGFDELKKKISEMILSKLKDFEGKDVDLKAIEDLYNNIVQNVNIKAENRKNEFINKAQDIVMPMAGSVRTNPYNIQDYTVTLEFTYWELRLNNIKPNTIPEIIKLSLISDFLINDSSVKALFKPAGNIVKTIQTLVSKYDIKTNKFDVTFDDINNLP